MKKALTVGLTGQTGAGKTTVSEVFVSRSVAVIDCDEVSREVVADEKHCLADLALEFTIDILNADGSLNRQRLAERAFADKNSVKRLNSIILPYIVTRVREKTEKLEREGAHLIVWDAPTLFESRLDKKCDKIVAVVAPADVCLARITERDGLSEREAERRMRAGNSEEFFRLNCDYLIENNGTLSELRMSALDVLEKLREAAGE